MKYIKEMVYRFPIIKVFIFDTARFAVARSKITQNDAYEGNYNERDLFTYNLDKKLFLI